MSLRAGYPGWAAPRQDPSYLRGETQDLLAKLETPLLKGSLRLLFFELGNSVALSTQAETTGPRNGFEWGSRSIGAQWGRDLGSAVVRLQGWSASSEAEATWLGAAPLDMVGERQDQGLLALLETDGLTSSTTAGFRLERSHTTYRSGMANTSPVLELNPRVPLATGFLQHRRELRRRLTGSAGMAEIWAAGGCIRICRADSAGASGSRSCYRLATCALTSSPSHFATVNRWWKHLSGGAVHRIGSQWCSGGSQRPGSSRC